MVAVSSKLAVNPLADNDVWTVPANNVLLMREALLAEGVSEMELLRNTGISPKQIKNIDSLLTFDQVRAITENAVRLTKIEGLGLKIGRNESPVDWGVLGYAMMSCSTIGDVINTLLRFHRTAASMTDVLFTVEDEFAVLELAPVRPLGRALPFIIEEHFSATHSLLETLAGRNMPLLRVNLMYEKPIHYRQYAALFSCPISFCEAKNQLVFDEKFLAHPVAHSNKFSVELASQICADQLARQTYTGSFVQKIRYLILLQGSNFPSIETVSDRLNITSRTLRNRLSREGTSFQFLLDDVRLQLALNYLQSSKMQVDEIASLLGFSDRSNFRRAFKRWTGKTPLECRM